MTKVSFGSFTDKSSRGTAAIINMVKRTTLLSPEETQAHMLHIFNKDKNYAASIEALVLHNLGLVVSKAKLYQGLGFNLEDLIQEGICGLIKAAQTVRPCENGFVPYASFCIKHAILRSISKYGGIAMVPHSYFDLCYAYEDIEERKLKEDEYKPSFEEVALELHQTQDFDDEKLLAALEVFKKHESLDAPLKQISDDGSITLNDNIGDKSTIIKMEKEMLRKEVKRMLQQMLTPEEYSIVYDFYGYSPEIYSREMICKMYGISSITLSRIHSRAKAKILAHPLSYELHQLLRAITNL